MAPKGRLVLVTIKAHDQRPRRLQKSSAVPISGRPRRSPSPPGSAQRHEGCGKRGSGRSTDGRLRETGFFDIAQFLFTVDTSKARMNEACSCALAIGDAAQADTHQKPRPDRNGERSFRSDKNFSTELIEMSQARKIQPLQSLA